jgi:hypothetical protein
VLFYPIVNAFRYTIVRSLYPIVNAFRYTIVRSLYWRIKAILADFVRIPSNFRIRMKIPSRRRMHPSIVQVDPTPPGHPAEAREFVRVPATSCGRCRASLGGPAGFSSPAAAAASSRPDTRPCAPPPPTPRAPAGGIMATPLLFLMAPYCNWEDAQPRTACPGGVLGMRRGS